MMARERQRLFVLLRREGQVVNNEQLFRLYREKKLTVRRRNGHKRAIGMRAPRVKPPAPNACCLLDFNGANPTAPMKFIVDKNWGMVTDYRGAGSVRFIVFFASNPTLASTRRQPVSSRRQPCQSS